MPLSQPLLSNDARTPKTLAWLRTIYARPATQRIWAMGRTSLAQRVTYLSQKPEAADA